MPKVSIITVTYNNAEGLEKTIQSVRDQKSADIEHIIIDGGSTDNTTEVIANNELAIATWVSEPDSGIYNAMNKGIVMASGEYVFFLNSGDHFYHSRVLEQQIQQIVKYDIIAFDIHVIGSKLNLIKSHPKKLHFSYLFKDTLAHQSVFIKRELFNRVGPYVESLEIVADWKLFLDAFVHHGATYSSIPEVLSVYYLDGKSATKDGTAIRIKERERILKEEYGLFYNDYMRLQTLNLYRFKMLSRLETSKHGRKITSGVLRVLLKLFGK